MSDEKSTEPPVSESCTPAELSALDRFVHAAASVAKVEPLDCSKPFTMEMLKEFAVKVRDARDSMSETDAEQLIQQLVHDDQKLPQFPLFIQLLALLTFVSASALAEGDAIPKLMARIEPPSSSRYRWSADAWRAETLVPILNAVRRTVGGHMVKHSKVKRFHSLSISKCTCDARISAASREVG